MSGTVNRIVERMKPIKELLQIATVIGTTLVFIMTVFYTLLVSKITEIVKEAINTNSAPIERKLETIDNTLWTMFKYDLHSLSEKIKDNPEEVQITEYERSLNLCKIYKDSKDMLLMDAQMERECVLIESRYVDNLSDRRLKDKNR